MDLFLIIITAYFWGKKVDLKGYSSYRWRVRHVSACIFTEALTMTISMSIQPKIEIALYSGFIALVGILVYRYEKLKKLPINQV
ncbi:MAG TPA: hypothetical protein PKX92_02180 [Edaphocola sp.]|nr:hypothetical protein [Edaphocola sp.]